MKVSLSHVNLVSAASFAAVSAFATPRMSARISTSGYSGSAPLVNFPVLVRIAEYDAATGKGIMGFAYADCAADGRDIAFKDAQGNALPREIDTWTTSGESLVWVCLPVCANNTTFSMTWGDAAVAAQPPCQTNGSVWTAAGYVGVWHMSEASGAVADATAHGLTATPGGSYTVNSVAVSGKIGNARQNAALASQPGNLVVPNYDSFNVGDTFAVGGWFNLTDNSSSDNRFFSRKKTYTDQNGWEIMHKGGQANFNNRKINLRGRGNSKTIQSTSGMDIAGTGWQHFLFVYNGSSATIYHNGSVLAASGSIDAATDNGESLGIGSYREAAASCIVGSVDECRLLDAVPSADWAAADYATQSDASFLTYGQAEILAAEGAINIRGNPANIGSPSPAYGLHTDVSEITFSMPVTAVAGEGTVSNFLAGWTLDGVDIGSGIHTRIHSSSDPGASISSFTYVRDVPYAEFTWLWETRYAAAVSAPRPVRSLSDALELEVDVDGLGYGGAPSLAFAWRVAGEASATTNVVAAAIGECGAYSATLSGLAAGSDYDVQALLLGDGGAVIAASETVRIATSPAAEGPVFFLKADATGTGDGSSWTDAFTQWSNAVVAVRAAGSARPVTLYVAAGLYGTPSTEPVSPTFPTAFTNASFAVRGGCRAAYDGDVARDPALYHSIVTTWSTNNLRKATWKRRSPDPATYAHTDSDVKVNGSNFRIIGDDGRLQFPDFEGDHDVFYSSGSGGNKPIYIGGEGASGVVDGIKVVCCNRGSNRAGEIFVASGAGDVLVTNCVVAGCSIQSGAVSDEGGTAGGRRTTVVDCQFLYNQFSYGVVGVISKGNATVRRCLFQGNSQTGVHAGEGLGLLKFDGTGCVAEDCVLARNYQRVSDSSRATLALGSGVFRRLVVTNNYNLSRHAVANPMVTLKANGSNEYGLLRDSLFADNILQFIPEAGSVAVLVSGHDTGAHAAPSVVNCVFRNNAVLAVSNNLPSGASCAFGIVGNASYASKNAWTTLEGCTFVSNRAEIVDMPDGVAAVLSRGVLSYASASSTIQYGLANCTFFGPGADGVFDIAQYGENTQPLNVVNSVFALDDPNAVAAPFSWTDAATAHVVDCAIQNWYPSLRPSGYGTLDGVKYDPIPLDAVATGVGDAFALRPAARTPGIRETCDIATNAPAKATVLAPTFAFRTRDDGAEWQMLVPNAPGTLAEEKEPFADPFGAARPFGATTAGAVQALTATAENGSTLTLRRDPFDAGTLSTPFVQAAADGDAFAPVAATPVGDGDFIGWLDENGTTFSTANPLELTASGDDVVLTASFGTAAVTLTFDLGSLATFDGTGASTYSASFQSGTAFPAIPPFTVRDGYVFVSWPDFPSSVPYESARYEAKIVSSSVRRFHVAPGASGSGLSWSDPADLATAYAEAAAYRGELWLKEGEYVLQAAITLLPNVAVVGGFAGDETDASQSDPESHPAIIAGCGLENLYWMPNGSDPGIGNRPAVWTDGAFNEPNPDFSDNYWQPASTDAAGQLYAFVGSSGTVVTNASLSGLVFTGFRLGAVSLLGCRSDGLAVSDCRFLANGTAANAGQAAVMAQESPFALHGCDFVGNYRNVAFNLAGRPYTNVIADCRFLDSANAGIGCSVSTNGSFEVSRCLFARNFSDSRAPVLDLASQWHFGLAAFSDCVAVSNRVASGGQALLRFNCSNKTTGGREYAATPCLEFRRCDFTENTGTDVNALLVSMGSRYASVAFRDCFVAGNSLSNAKNNAALVRDDGYMLPTFVNCLFEKNSVEAPASDAGIVLFAWTQYRRSATIGCTFVDNAVRGAAPDRAADIIILNGYDGYPHTIVNTLFDERASGHWPIHGDTNVHFRLWGVYTAGQTTNDMGVVHLDIRGHSSDDPRIAARTSIGPNGRPGRPTKARSQACGGHIVQQGLDGNYYVHRPWQTGGNPQIWSAQPDARHLTAAEGAEQGLDPAGDAIPDAWGQSRPAGGPFSLGHVNRIRPATMLIMH